MDRVFGIIPASPGAFTFLWVFSAVIGVVLIGVIVLFVSFGYQARHLAFTISGDGLRIGPGLYGRFIPAADIDTTGVRVINLNIETGYRPKWRTNGAGLPGFNEGWFKLENKEKALVFVTDRTSVVYIPTHKNYAVLLSVREADMFADAIRHW